MKRHDARTVTMPLVIAMLSALVATSTQAQEIRRHPFTGPAAGTLLEAATLPPGAETLLLSGRVASRRDAPGAPMTPAVTAAQLGDTRRQTEDILDQIRATLEKHGWSMADIVRLTVYLVGDPARDGRMDFDGMNQAYRLHFGSTANPNLPVRSTVQVVALAHPAYLVEIEATAARVPNRP